MPLDVRSDFPGSFPRQIMRSAGQDDQGGAWKQLVEPAPNCYRADLIGIAPEQQGWRADSVELRCHVVASVEKPSRQLRIPLLELGAPINRSESSNVDASRRDGKNQGTNELWHGESRPQRNDSAHGLREEHHGTRDFSDYPRHEIVDPPH
jgi:hypothetical protein